MDLSQLFSKSKTALNAERVAELLKTSPEAMIQFERAYHTHALSVEDTDNFFEVNSRQASKQNHIIVESGNRDFQAESLQNLQRRIVEELLAQTKTYVYDGEEGKYKEKRKALKDAQCVQNAEIAQFPKAFRPQLSGNLMMIDIDDPACKTILFFYQLYQQGKNDKVRQMAYNHFRQGMDILDLDEITYHMIGMNPNSMGHWLPRLVDANRNQGFFQIPKTVVAKVPITLLQLTRCDYGSLTPTTLAIVDQWAKDAFSLDVEKDYFIKTGTYSSKFDFRNAHVHGEKEVKELGEYLLFVHFQALQMASPLSQPTIVGVSTTTEWVVREFIPDKESNPCIYKGLPLHTEYRVFVDCDTNTVLSIVPYWDPSTMKQRFGHEQDAASPHQVHDYIVYQAHEGVLMERYEKNKESVAQHIKEILPNLDLPGQWSIDVMQNGDEFWLIDMAKAENSAYYNSVPKHLRKTAVEKWIPEEIKPLLS